MNKLYLSIILSSLSVNSAFATSENGVAWSPDNKHIALHSNKDGGSHLYTVNAQTLEWTQLTTTGFSRYPSWSDKGDQLVFMSWQDEDEGFSTYMMNLDNKKIRRVSTDKKTHLGPAISPDGTKIAYCVGGKTPQIWLMNTDGSNAKLLTNDKQNGCWPKWLPDNQTLIFGAPNKNAADDFDIASLNIKTGKFSYLFTSEGHDWGPTFSKNDQRIYFNSLKDSNSKDMMTGNWNIYSMTTSGDDVRKEISNSAFDSTISASYDGKYIAYATINNKEHKIKLLDTKHNVLKNVDSE